MLTYLSILPDHAGIKLFCITTLVITMFNLQMQSLGACIAEEKYRIPICKTSIPAEEKKPESQRE